MPVGQTQLGGATKSELDIYQSQLNSWYKNQDTTDYKDRQMQERSWYDNTLQGAAKGVFQTGEAAANFIPDFAGADQRVFTFSDYIPDNPHSTNFELSKIGSHLVSSYLLGHRVMKRVGGGPKTKAPWSKDQAKRWGGRPKSDKQIAAMDDKTRAAYVSDMAKSKRAADRAARERGLTPQKLFEVGKQGVGTGVIAEGIFWRGQDEELLVNWLQGFFNEHSELETIVEQAIEANPDWVNAPANELGESITYSWNAFQGNALGRMKFAGEGAVFGIFFNYLAASLKVAAKTAGRTTSSGLRRILAGRDAAAKIGADATEAGANVLSKKQQKLQDAEDLAFGGDKDTVAEINKAEDELTNASVAAHDAAEADEAFKRKDRVDVEDETMAPRSWDDDTVNEASAGLKGDDALYDTKPVKQDESIPVRYEQRSKEVPPPQDPSEYYGEPSTAWTDKTGQHIPLSSVAASGKVYRGSSKQRITVNEQGDLVIENRFDSMFNSEGTSVIDDPQTARFYAVRDVDQKIRDAEMNIYGDDEGAVMQWYPDGPPEAEDTLAQFAENEGLVASIVEIDEDAWLAAVKDLDVLEGQGTTRGKIEQRVVSDEPIVIPAGKWNQYDNNLENAYLDKLGSDRSLETTLPVLNEGDLAVKIAKPDEVPFNGSLTATTVSGGKKTVHIDRDAATTHWKGWKDETVGDELIPKDVFANYEDYERYLIERETAKSRFPKLRGESDANYELRVRKHAMNSAKRKGIGDFYKYEFDPDAPKGLQLTESEQLRVLFGEGNDEAGRKVVEILRNAGKARGKSVTDAMNEAAKIINIDNTMTDIGSKYLTGRVMSFFIHNLRQGFSNLPDEAVNFKKKDVDTLADALGFVKDPHRRGPAAILEEDVLNAIDDIADSNAIGRDAMAERIRQGRGEFRKLYGELAPATSMDESMRQDVKVLKEAYIRSVAYKMDSIIQVKKLKQLTEDISKMSDEEWAANKGLQQAYNAELERIAMKVSNIQKLATASGRMLRAQQDFHKAVFSDMEQHIDQMKYGNPKQLKKHAQRLHAVMEANRHDAVSEAIASKKYLAQTVRGIDVHNEYWLNSILSGTKTQLVNFVSTGLHLYYKPLEGMLGSMMRLDPAQAKVMMDQLVQTAMINASVVRVLGSLGWNNFKHMGGMFDNAGFHANRAKIFKRGQEGTGPLAQATGAVAGARKSFRHGEGTLSQNSDLFDVKQPHAISGDLLGEASDGSFFGSSLGARATLEYVGNIVRLPMRMMITTDELFKQMSFRATAMSKLSADALDAGFTKAEDIARYIADNFTGLIRKNGQRHSGKAIQDEAYREHGKILSRFNEKSTSEFPEQYRDRDAFLDDYVAHHYNPNKGKLSERAMDWAEDVTYTRRLDKDVVFLKSLGKTPKAGSLMQDTQDMVHRHPFLRLVMPFVKTPVNILKFPLQRMSIPGVISPNGTMLGKEYQWLKNMHSRYQADMASGDPQRMAEAAGRIWAGRFYWVSSIGLASSGVITGGGPSNPSERTNLIATGWRPYSVRIDDKYISYSRLDPFSSVLGLAADTYEKFAEQGKAGDIEEDGFTAVMLAGAYSVSNNIADKSYLSGINNVLQAFLEPETKLKALLKKQSGSYIPKIVSQWTPLTDDHYMKKTYGILEGLAVRIPGAAKYVEPMRNYLGDPIESMYAPTVWAAGLNPFLVSQAKNDKVLDEIGYLDYGFGAPTARIKGSRHLDMRKFFDDNGRSAFDRFQEAIGQEKINGLTIRNALERLFDSPAYQKASLMADKGELFHQGTFRDPRIKAVKSLMSRFRNRAKNRVLVEYPNLLGAVKTYNWQTESQMKKLLEN
jgi:hypothetical protein